MEGNNAPVIRFNGFNAAWEQRKFSEIVDVCSGRDYKHLNEGPIPVYGTGGYMTSVCEALSHNRDAVGIGRKGTIDKPYLLKAPFWTVDTLFYAIPKPDINLEFALCSFLNVDWKSKDESTGLPSLSKEAINETVLRVPNAVEQNHLGSFFTNIDSLITLHQRKCDKLVKLKPAMLNRMFPKPGDSEPEIRFAGFKEPWERYKLGDVAAIARGERFTASDYVESGGIPCIHYGEIYTSYGTIATKTISQVSSSLKDSLRYAKQGDVIVAATSENVEDVCKAVVWMGNSPVAYHDDSFALTFSGDPIFLVSFFETSEFFAQKSSAAHGVKVMRVSSDSLADVGLPLPSAAEQRLIGGYFAKLDNLITLHRRKIKGLKKIKSAMLDKMFV